MTRINLVGDITIRAPLDALHQRKEHLMSAVAAASDSDLLIANLEMPLSQRGYRVPKWSSLRSDPVVINDVRALGVDIVSLANNHMMDYGPEAMADTLAACHSAGIAHCGAGPDLETALSPVRVEVHGCRLALLSVSCTLPNDSHAAPGKPGIAPIHVGFSFEVDTNLLAEQPGTMPTVRSWARAEDCDRICERLSVLRSEADLVIVAIHWGVPAYWLSPAQGPLAEYQQPLGHALIDAGADVVCGTHSHSLHPIEWYRGKPIFYSLGNFLFEEPRDFMESESVVVGMEIGQAPEFELVPLMLNAQGLPSRASGCQALHVLTHLQRLSAPFGVGIEVRDECGYLSTARAPAS